MDFTLVKYEKLLKTLKEKEYNFQTFAEFLKSPKKKSVILRHDVDLMPKNSLRFAKIQYKYGVSGTYFFRSLPCSFDIEIIKQISELKHEIGYHYENMDTHKGNFDLALKDFKEKLNLFRSVSKIETICMHGSPLSNYDNKDLWNKFDYKSLDLIGEPYFDLDFEKIFYFTDTGRSWNGEIFSVRDKVKSKLNNQYIFKSTEDMISRINNDDFPNQLMITFHPQRWNNNIFLWFRELVFQKLKNLIKYFLIKARK